MPREEWAQPRGRKSIRRRCGSGDRGAAVLRPDQAMRGRVVRAPNSILARRRGGRRAPCTRGRTFQAKKKKPWRTKRTASGFETIRVDGGATERAHRCRPGGGAQPCALQRGLRRCRSPGRAVIAPIANQTTMRRRLCRPWSPRKEEDKLGGRRATRPARCLRPNTQPPNPTPPPAERPSLTPIERKEFNITDLERWMREADQAMRRATAVLDQLADPARSVPARSDRA